MEEDLLSNIISRSPTTISASSVDADGGNNLLNRDFLNQIYFSPVYLDRLKNKRICSFSSWITVIVVVDFDVNEGHQVAEEYPSGVLSIGEKNRLICMSLPDSNAITDAQQDCFRDYHKQQRQSVNQSSDCCSSQRDNKPCVSAFKTTKRSDNTGSNITSSVSSRSDQSASITPSQSAAHNVPFGRNCTESCSSQSTDSKSYLSEFQSAYLNNWLCLRFRRDSPLSLKNSGPSDQIFSVGASVFRSEADLNNRRRAKQEAVVLLSPLPIHYFIPVILPLTLFTAEAYFKYGSSALYDVCASVALWPFSNNLSRPVRLNVQLSMSHDEVFLSVPEEKNFLEDSYLPSPKPKAAAKSPTREVAKMFAVHARRLRRKKEAKNRRQQIRTITRSSRDHLRDRFIAPDDSAMASDEKIGTSFHFFPEADQLQSFSLYDATAPSPLSSQCNVATPKQTPPPELRKSITRMSYWTPRSVVSLWPLIRSMSDKVLPLDVQATTETSLGNQSGTRFKSELDFNPLASESVRIDRQQSVLRSSQTNREEVCSIQHSFHIPEGQEGNIAATTTRSASYESNEVGSQQSTEGMIFSDTAAAAQRDLLHRSEPSLNTFETDEGEVESILSSLSSLFAFDHTPVERSSSCGVTNQSLQNDIESFGKVPDQRAVSIHHNAFKKTKESLFFQGSAAPTEKIPKLTRFSPPSCSAEHEEMPATSECTPANSVVWQPKLGLGHQKIVFFVEKADCDSLESETAITVKRHHDKSKLIIKSLDNEMKSSRLGSIRSVLKKALRDLAFRHYLKKKNSNKVPFYKPQFAIPFQSIPSPPLLSTLGPLAASLWILWELMITEAPLLVLSSNATRSSSIVLAMLSLIHPLKYGGDYRPYVNTYEPDVNHYRELLESDNEDPIPLLIGASDPLFLMILARCPNIMVLEAPKSSFASNPPQVSFPSKTRTGFSFNAPGTSSLAFRQDTTAGPSRASIGRSIFQSKTVRTTWLKIVIDPSIPKDVVLNREIQDAVLPPTQDLASLFGNLGQISGFGQFHLGRMIEAAGMTNSSSSSGNPRLKNPIAPITSELELKVLQYFHDLTVRFLKPFEPYVKPETKHLMMNPLKETPKPTPFLPDQFIDTIGGTLAPVMPPFSQMPRSKVVNLYQKFITTRTFRIWFLEVSSQHRIDTERLQFSYCAAINIDVLFPRLDLSEIADGCALLRHLLRECQHLSPRSELLRIQSLLTQLKKRASSSFVDQRDAQNHVLLRLDSNPLTMMMHEKMAPHFMYKNVVNQSPAMSALSNSIPKIQFFREDNDGRRPETLIQDSTNNKQMISSSTMDAIYDFRCEVSDSLLGAHRNTTNASSHRTNDSRKSDDQLQHRQATDETEDTTDYLSAEEN